MKTGIKYVASSTTRKGGLPREAEGKYVLVFQFAPLKAEVITRLKFAILKKCVLQKESS